MLTVPRVSYTVASQFHEILWKCDRFFSLRSVSRKVSKLSERCRHHRIQDFNDERKKKTEFKLQKVKFYLFFLSSLFLYFKKERKNSFLLFIYFFLWRCVFDVVRKYSCPPPHLSFFDKLFWWGRIVIFSVMQ